MVFKTTTQLPLLGTPLSSVQPKPEKKKYDLDPKYYWKIGRSLPKLDQHSRVKHQIIEEYIQQYVRTVMSQATIPEIKISIIDGFCGGGCYQTERGNIVDGSPLIVMRAIKTARALINMNRNKERKVNAQYFFVDIIPDNTEHLDYWLKAKREENSIDHNDFEKVKIIKNDFLLELPNIIEKVKSWKGGERAIFILDQYSYKDAPMSTIASILKQLKSSEIILTFNVDNLVTYLSDRAANRKALENIQLDKYMPWEALSNIKKENRHQWRQILQRHLAYGIKKESGAKFMTLFFVKPFGETSWGYWLVHLSNHYRAHDVMKTIHWENATDFGHEIEPGIFVLGYNANKDDIYTGQNSFIFDDNLKIACINEMHEFFGKRLFELNKPMPIGQLFQSCVSDSTAAEVHLQTATNHLHTSKNVVITSKDGRIRKPSKKYEMDDIIECRPQFIMI